MWFDLVEMICAIDETNQNFVWKKVLNWIAFWSWILILHIYNVDKKICLFIINVKCSSILIFIAFFYQPLPETVALVEDIVVEYVTDFVSVL